MNTCIVDRSEPVTVLGGGAADVGDVAEALALAPTCVAADGGLTLALAAGVEPVAVIGDFDSVRTRDLARIPAVNQHRIAEQDSTDFDKALRHINAPVVLGVGFTGARIDHQLAAFNVLVRHPDRPCILLGADEIVFLCPPRLEVPTQVGEVVSLFPMRPVTGRSTGLRWPIDGLDFAPGGMTGTSNAALGRVSLQMDGPGMLAILPRRHLADVTQALATLSGAQSWPQSPVPAARYTGPPQS
ncbi:MAG: thiamine diphosphokinase [Pseudomonadota bacterium]